MSHATETLTNPLANPAAHTLPKHGMISTQIASTTSSRVTTAPDGTVKTGGVTATPHGAAPPKDPSDEGMSMTVKLALAAAVAWYFLAR
jgi:hypothetical protein